jgi:hypothetical protein
MRASTVGNYIQQASISSSYAAWRMLSLLHSHSIPEGLRTLSIIMESNRPFLICIKDALRESRRYINGSITIPLLHILDAESWVDTREEGYVTI